MPGSTQLCQAVPGYAKPGCARPCRAMPDHVVPRQAIPSHTEPCRPCRATGPQPCRGGLRSPARLRSGPDAGPRCHAGHPRPRTRTGTRGVTWPRGCPTSGPPPGRGRPHTPGSPAAPAAPRRDLPAGVTGIMTGSLRGAEEEPVLNNVQIGHVICAVSSGRGDPPPPPPSVTKRWWPFGGGRSPPVTHPGSPPGHDVGPVAPGQTCCAHLLITGDPGGGVAGTSHPCRDALRWRPGPPTDPRTAAGRVVWMPGSCFGWWRGRRGG